MKIILAGADGQMSRCIQQDVAENKKHEIVSFNRKDLDITDAVKVLETVKTVKPDAIINGAAYNLVDQAETERDLAMAINAQGPENLARAAAALNIPVVHVSTDYVFDGKKGSPYVESDKVNPLSVYAKSKLAGEERVLKASAKSYVVRTAWVYSTEGKNFPLAMLALKDKPFLSIVNDQIGSPTYAPDLARKIIMLIEKSFPFGVYHVAGAGTASRYDQLKVIFDGLGIKTPLKPVASKDFFQKAERPPFSALTTERGADIKLRPWEQAAADFVRKMNHGMRVS